MKWIHKNIGPITSVIWFVKPVIDVRYCFRNTRVNIGFVKWISDNASHIAS